MSAHEPAGQTSEALPQPGQPVRTAYGEPLGSVIGTTGEGLIVEEAGPARARRLVPHSVISAVDKNGVHIWATKEDLPSAAADGGAVGADAPPTAAGAAGENRGIELNQEELVPSTAWEQAGEVHLRTTTETFPAAVDVSTRQEKLLVERVAVNQVVDKRRDPWQDGDTLIVPVYEERLVVTKQLVMTEEFRVRRVEETREQHFSDTLQRERLVIDDPDGTGAVELRDAEQSGIAGAIKKLLH